MGCVPGRAPLFPHLATALAVEAVKAGKFGERWRDLAKAYGCAVDVLSAPYGQTFTLDAVRARLAPEVRAVYMQATESSTGARHDVQGVAAQRQSQGGYGLRIRDQSDIVALAPPMG